MFSSTRTYSIFVEISQNPSSLDISSTMKLLLAGLFTVSAVIKTALGDGEPFDPVIPCFCVLIEPSCSIREA